MSLVIVSPEENSRFDSAIAKSAKAAQKRNRRPIQPRHSSIVKDVIDRLKEPLERFTRNLQEAEEARANVVKSLDSVTARIAGLRAAGLRDNSSELQALIGFSFLGADKVTRVFHEGSLQIMQGELERLDKRIATLKTAVENSQTLCDRDLPQLHAEYDAARKMEA